LEERSGFDSTRLAAELRAIFRELCRDCTEQDAYRHIIEYIMFRISQDTGIKTEYILPESGCSGSFEKLRAALDRNRYDFRTAAEKNLLGEMYENFLDRETKKKLGLFYTPNEVIDYIIMNTLEKADVVENPYIKVLDPACGSGYFLTKAYDVLRKKFEENEEKLKERYGEGTFCRENIHSHIIGNCIFGADIDEFGAMFTKTALAFKDMSGGLCSPRIAVCDSLVKWEEDGEGELASFWSGGFDYIIGNPPWVSLSRKQGKQIPEENLFYYRDHYHGNSYLPNLYEYFLQRSLELVRQGGSVGFLIPDRFAKNKQFGDFRKQILLDFRLECLMFGISMKGVLADSMAIIIGKPALEENITEIRAGGTSFGIPQNSMLESDGFRFESVSIEDRRNMLQKMHRDAVQLKEISRSFTGFIGLKEKLTEQKVEGCQVPALKGEDISRYKISGSRYYDISSENIIGGTKDSRKLLAKDKILVRKTGSRIVAALDESGYAPEQSLYGIILNSGEYMPSYILAVLNSRLMEEYYRSFLVTNANSTPQIKKMDLDSIPIKKCSRERQAEIAEIVESLTKEYKPEQQERLDGLICDIYGE